MVIRTSVQSLPICGYSFSKKNFLDIKPSCACPAHAQGWYPDEWRYSKRFMTPLTRHHVTKQFFPSSQPGRCLRILDVPALSAISLEKAHPRGFLLSILFSWSVFAYSVGCWLDSIKGPSLLLFGRAATPPPLFFSRAILPNFLSRCHEVHIRIDCRPWHTPCRERERRDLQGHR
jgi:hypothetical protein